MIENRWAERGTLRNQEGKHIEYPGYTRNIFPHCNPTNNKGKRKTPNIMKDIKFLVQSICKLCRGKITYVCSSCGDYVCNGKSDQLCLYKHREENN